MNENEMHGSKPAKSDREYLLDAAKYIEDNGLLKGKLGGWGGPACLVGSIREVLALHGGTGDWWRETFARCRTLVTNHLEMKLGQVWVEPTKLTEWNDAPERTQDEVVAALRDAARAA